jgi:virulence-associated protein VapD
MRTRRTRQPTLSFAASSSHLATDEPRYLPNEKQWKRGRMYAISFDLDTDMLQKLYHNTSFNNAYADVKRVLSNHGFENRQGSVYFPKPEDMEKIDAVKCVLAVQDLTHQFSWFAGSVRDIRMLRIEENNDLMPAIDAVRAATP